MIDKENHGTRFVLSQDPDPKPTFFGRRRMILQVPSGKNGRLKIVRCPCCGEPLAFPSFKKAKVKAEELGYRTYRISRIAFR